MGVKPDLALPPHCLTDLAQDLSLQIIFLSIGGFSLMFQCIFDEFKNVFVFFQIKCFIFFLPAGARAKTKFGLGYTYRWSCSVPIG